MTRFVSLNQFVNLWECDENDHMNVQFYYSKFEDAGSLFALVHGFSQRLGPQINRHVRYHSELRGGAQIRITSSIVSDFGDLEAPGDGCFIQHVMQEVTSGRIAATALDWFEGESPSLDADIFDAVSRDALPRGLKQRAAAIPAVQPATSQDIIARGVLHPALCSADMVARDQAFVGAVSDAASHAWDRVGLSAAWLEAQGLGRVAVEMRLSIAKPMQAGTPYQMQLCFTGLQSRAFTKCYDFFDMRYGTHLARLEAAAMILNHTTRRSEPLPDFTRAAIEAQLASS